MIQSDNSYIHVTGSQLLRNGAGSIKKGVLCNASSSGTLTLYDNTAGSGTVIVNACPLTAGQFYPLNFKFGKGLYATIGGTADLTFMV